MAGLLACSFVGCADGERSDPAAGPSAQVASVHALGRVQPAGGLISIAGPVGDRLVKLDPDVVANKPAPADGILGRLASYDLRLAQLQALQARRRLTAQKHRLELLAARGNVTAATATVAQAEAKRAEVLAQEARIEALREAADIGDDDYRQLVELAAGDPGLASRGQLRRRGNQADRARAEYEVAHRGYESALRAADAGCESARASLAAAEANLKGLEAYGPLEAIDAEIRVAEESLKQSFLWSPGSTPSAVRLEDLQCVAGSPPGDLTVLSVRLRPGETIAQTPVMELGDLRSLECIAEVFEEDARHIKVGHEATVESRALTPNGDASVAAVVRHVAHTLSPPGVVNRNPLAPVDRSVVEVRLELRPEGRAQRQAIKRLIGLQVSVRFELESRPPAPADSTAG